MNSMMAASLAAEKNEGPACLAGIFTMASLRLSKRRWRVLLYKLTTRLSAEVGRYVIDCLPSSIFTNRVQRFAPTAVIAAFWSSSLLRGYGRVLALTVAILRIQIHAGFPVNSRVD